MVRIFHPRRTSWNLRWTTWPALNLGWFGFGCDPKAPQRDSHDKFRGFFFRVLLIFHGEYHRIYHLYAIKKSNGKSIPMNISSIKWEGSRHAIFRFMYLQLQPFRGSLTLFYSDFKVVGEICRDLFRFLQCSHDPGFMSIKWLAGPPPVYVHRDGNPLSMEVWRRSSNHSWWIFQRRRLPEGNQQQ